MRKFWQTIWKWLKAPFIWIKDNIKDWRTAVIFAIVLIIVSSSVWIFLLLGLITGNGWFYGIASAVFIWWQLPGSPFFMLCIGITIGIKSLFNKVRRKREDKNKQVEEIGKE